jgi:hypothetical protein
VGGMIGLGVSVLPHMQLSPQVQDETLSLSVLPQHELAAAVRPRVQQHRPCFTFSEEQQHFNCPSFWQQLLLLVHPHEAAGRHCAGTAMAASQINVRATIALVIHMKSNPLLAATISGRRDFISVIGTLEERAAGKTGESLDVTHAGTYPHRVHTCVH